MKLKNLVLAVIFAFLLASCTVNSPISVTKQFLSFWQKEQYNQVASLIVKATAQENNKFKIESLSDEEKTEFIKTLKEEKGGLGKFEVQNAVPLNKEVLDKLQTNEGYEVFFYTETEKKGSENKKYYLLKVDDKWRILPSM